MKAFAIDHSQIARVLAALAADELARSFKKHKDFLTIAGWKAETPLGAGGLALNETERTACAQRAAEFFGLAIDSLERVSAERLADWAKAIEAAIDRKLEIFAFAPAGRDNDDAPVAHAADEMFQDAAAAANLLYGRRRVLSLVSPHSLLGFILTVLTPNLQRVAVCDARGMAPEALSGALAFGDALVATPTLWRYAMREGLAAPDNVMGVTFGEPMTAELAVDMRKAGFSAMRELYGSTETGVIGWRDGPGEAFVLFDHWRREGEGIVRRPPGGGERAIEPMDILAWDGARSFRLAGRRDGAIQVGAVNVFPDRIAEIIRRHPRVAACRMSVSKPRNGVNRLVAHIVLADNAPPSETAAREIDGWCRENLRPQERPRIYNFESAVNAPKKNRARRGP
ncbi:MAG: hypothetical protein ACE5FO_03915 [Parvularculaceae bacterium]